MFETISPLFTSLYETTGLNFNVFYDQFTFQQFLSGVQTTCLLAACCLSLSIIIGIFGAWAQQSRLSAVRIAVNSYIQLFRNTPPYVQLLFFYFGVGQFVPNINTGDGSVPLIDSFGWAVITLGCFGGAFNVEIFRAGLQSVPSSLLEATEALGYTRFQSFRHVTLPLAIRFSMPALTGNLVSLLKTTSVASAIAVPEITQICAQIWSDYYNVPEMMFVLFASYNILVASFLVFMALVERRMKLPGYYA